MAQSGTTAADPRLVNMWECLTLMSYIQHAEKVPTQEPKTGHLTAQAVRTTWQEMLHRICVLCDFDQAADNFIALGVEQKSHGTRFWMASNGAVNGKTTEWLRKILRLLAEAIGANSRCHEALATEIWEGSVRNSRGKVHNYHRRLKSIVAAAEQEQKDKPVVSDAEWGRMSQALQEMTSEDKHDRLCDLAHDFPSTDEFNVLGDLIRAKTNTGSRLQHYIGRLGSWKRAAFFIVNHAREFAHVFRKTSLKALETQPSTAIFTVETDMRRLVSRQCPLVAGNRPLLDNAVKQLETAGNQISKYGGAPQQPIEHAEAIIAQHFHVNKLQFACNERYVGSAKSSCYACALFINMHPGDFSAHTSHGHAWLRWSPPRPEESNFEHDQETWDLIRKMTQAMRREIDNCILNRRFGTDQNFSSTTGITAAAGP